MSTDSDDSGKSLSIQQDVKGDRLVAIGQVIDGTVINSVEILNQITQNLPRSPESAHYSLPLDAADFTGREDEIQQIEADLRAGQVVAIAGMAGVGKSTLAVRVAHRLKDQFPDGQIYLNLRGADSHPLTVESALESLLRALAVDPTQIPVERADKVALYRSRLAQTSTLMLLDNAAGARQVEDLLPGAGVCLITSRRQLDGLAGVKHLNLEALPEEPALELLQKIVPSERVQAEIDAARQIIQYCGRLPLALRIAAATLGMRSWQGKRLADYVRQLADERQRLDRLKLENLDIRASFELSYRELDTRAATLLGWLGLLPADFGTAILEPLTEEPPEAVQQALAALVDGRLVDPDNPSAGERYKLHDLMRLFALEKLEAKEELVKQIAARQRIILYLLQKVDLTNACLHPISCREIAQRYTANDSALSLEQIETNLELQALEWFEQELPNLRTAFSWALELKEFDKTIIFFRRLIRFLQLRNYWTHWKYIVSKSYETACEVEDQLAKAETLKSLGELNKIQINWRQARDFYLQSQVIFQKLGNQEGEAQCILGLSQIYCDLYADRAYLEQALSYAKQSCEIFNDLHDTYNHGISLLNLGNVYFNAKYLEQAEGCYQESLRIFHEFGDLKNEGSALNGLGNIYCEKKQYEEAIINYEKSIDIDSALGDKLARAIKLGNIGSAYKQQREWQRAINYYSKSIESFREIKDRFGEGDRFDALGNLYQEIGQPENAISCYQKSLEISRSLGEHSWDDWEPDLLKKIGDAFYYLYFQRKLKSYWESAVKHYHEGLDICNKLLKKEVLSRRESIRITQAQTLTQLAELHQEQGNCSESEFHYLESIKIWQDLGNDHCEGKTLASLGRLYCKQKRTQHAIALYQISLTKLHPSSPDHATVAQWLRAANQPRYPAWLQWLLPWAFSCSWLGI